MVAHDAIKDFMCIDVFWEAVRSRFVQRFSPACRAVDRPNIFAEVMSVCRYRFCLTGGGSFPVDAEGWLGYSFARPDYFTHPVGHGMLLALCPISEDRLILPQPGTAVKSKPAIITGQTTGGR